MPWTKQSSCKIPHWWSLWGLVEYFIWSNKDLGPLPHRKSFHTLLCCLKGVLSLHGFVFSCAMALTSLKCWRWQAKRKRKRNKVLGLQLSGWLHLSEKNSSMAFRAWLLSSCFSRCCKHSSKTDSSRPLRIKRCILIKNIYEPFQRFWEPRSDQFC